VLFRIFENPGSDEPGFFVNKKFGGASRKRTTALALNPSEPKGLEGLTPSPSTKNKLCNNLDA